MNEPCRKKLFLLILILSIFLLVGCFGEKTVSFPDVNLEIAVREALGRPTGEITADDLARLRELSAFAGIITDLSELEYAINLTRVELLGNQIIDISPLINLTNLTELSLGNNQIADLAPLADLTNLTLAQTSGQPIVGRI